MTYFFKYAFGVDGDREVIPSLTQTSGTVSYQKGFTYNYQRILGSDPLAIPVPRDQSNQLYYAITENIQQYQTQGVPNWITAADNLGVSYPYGLYAICRYDAGSGIQIWESTVDANTSTPGEDTNWRVISGNAQGVPVGTIIDYGGIGLPTSYIPCNNALLPRATYPLLLDAVTSTQTVTLTSGSAVFTVGDAFGLYGQSGTVDAPIPGMPIESTGFPSETRVLSVAGTTITATANATSSGSLEVTFFQWEAGDGSTTFNAPNILGRTTINQGGTASDTIGNCPGQKGGASTVALTIAQMPAHNHPGSTTAVSANATGGGAIPRGQDTNQNPQPFVTVANQGGGEAHNNIQPSAVTYKLVKYV